MRGLGLLRGLLVVLALAGLTAAARADDKTVRLAIVNTPKMSGLIDKLAADFEAQSGLEVAIYSGSDVYEKARAGEADLVISHYGKAGAQEFVQEGLGFWPAMVFSNQLVIGGHKSDPAGIRGLASASEAMAKIAKARAPFVANDLAGVDYLSNVLLAAAGNPDKTGWYLEHQAAKGRAVGLAEEKQGYVIWGALPFLRYLEKHPGSQMEVMVSADSVLQRVMAVIIVNPEKTPGVNKAGAEAFRDYLLAARTQAAIAAYRQAGFDGQLWWPAARHNNAHGLDE